MLLRIGYQLAPVCLAKCLIPMTSRAHIRPSSDNIALPDQARKVIANKELLINYYIENRLRNMYLIFQLCDQVRAHLRKDSQVGVTDEVCTELRLCVTAARTLS